MRLAQRRRASLRIGLQVRQEPRRRERRQPISPQRTAAVVDRPQQVRGGGDGLDGDHGIKIAERHPLADNPPVTSEYELDESPTVNPVPYATREARRLVTPPEQ